MVQKILLLFTVIGSTLAKAPLNDYKLLLNQSGEEKEVKDKVFKNLLQDMKANQHKLMQTVREWNETELMEHFGRMAPREMLSGPAAATSPEMVRTRIMRQIIRRQKEMAREIWLKIQSQDLAELKSDLAQTISLDQKFRSNAKQSYSEARPEERTEAGPSSPWHRPTYSSYYSYYGYNYFYDYSTMNTYPNYGYNFYQPSYNGNVYAWNSSTYPNYYYQNYYYPRYNRTCRLYNSTVFGMATVAAFVDWLRY